MSILERALRIGEGKKFKEFEQHVGRINDFEPELELDSNEELRERVDQLRERARNGEPLEDLLPESFALTREASKRTLGQRHFDVQLIGGMVLHDGSIAEMKTGEGKTLTATLPIVLNSLTGKGVHLVTVNDYLARRDAEWMRPIYETLGVSVGVIQAEERDDTKHAAYAADVTYGTNSEFGFDYLRDNLAVAVEDKYQRGHHYSIVDEVDNILIDEARTPLIISGAPEQAADLYYKFAKLAPIMQPGKKPEGLEAKSKEWIADFDYEPDEQHETVEATEFMKIYELQVVDIPTNMPMIRDDRNDQIYKTKDGKWKSVVTEIEERHRKEQPVLVGTISVEVSELLSEKLRQKGIPHTVLNAKPEHAEREGETIAEAGRPGAVTIATNMAGRGVDIQLGGNVEHLTHHELVKRGLEPDSDEWDKAWDEVFPQVSEQVEASR